MKVILRSGLAIGCSAIQKIGSCLILFLFSACTKKDIPHSGVESASQASKVKNSAGISVTTSGPTMVTPVSVNLGGNVVVSNGSTQGITRGICFNTLPGPTIAHSTVPGGSGTGSFNCTLSGLVPGTLYYARAFAVKNSIAYYGNQVSFTTQPSNNTVTDIDGNIYQTITIGTQTWMLENLRTTRYRDGSPIPNVRDSVQWSILTTGAYCDYQNSPANSNVYGRLYNLFTADDPRNIAPEGWHIPTLTEWNILLDHLGGSTIAGGKLKQAGLAYWATPNTGADNGSGFNALPGGVRTANAAFAGLGTMSFFLGRNNYFPLYHPILNHNSAGISSGGVTIKRTAGAIRCIKD